MTVRKADNLLRGDRTPAYVDRDTGAQKSVNIGPSDQIRWFSIDPPEFCR
jgi:hypothetical protein